MSANEIFSDGIRYVSAVAAAQESNLTRDYIARLCREGKLHAKLIGKHWYIEHSTLQSFLLEHRFALDRKHRELAEQRAREYKTRIDNARSLLENPLSPQKQAGLQESQALNDHGPSTGESAVLVARPADVIPIGRSKVLALRKFPVGAKEQMMRAFAVLLGANHRSWGPARPTKTLAAGGATKSA